MTENQQLLNYPMDHLIIQHSRFYYHLLVSILYNLPPDAVLPQLDHITYDTLMASSFHECKGTTNV